MIESSIYRVLYRNFPAVCNHSAHKSSLTGQKKAGQHRPVFSCFSFLSNPGTALLTHAVLFSQSVTEANPFRLLPFCPVPAIFLLTRFTLHPVLSIPAGLCSGSPASYSGGRQCIYVGFDRSARGTPAKTTDTAVPPYTGRPQFSVFYADFPTGSAIFHGALSAWGDFAAATSHVRCPHRRSRNLPMLQCRWNPAARTHHPA